MPMTEKGTFPIGLEVDGKYHRDFTLEEHQFRHTQAVMHDPAIDKARINDEAYYDACVYAKRLKVEGVEEITPEMIQGLHGRDGHALIAADGRLEERRRAFRDAAEAAQGSAGGAPEDGDGKGRD